MRVKEEFIVVNLVDVEKFIWKVFILKFINVFILVKNCIVVFGMDVIGVLFVWMNLYDIIENI